MGELHGYDVSVRNNISDRVCVSNVDSLEAGTFTLKADYSSGLDNTIAVVGCHGTSATPYHNSNLKYGGIYLDEDWMDKLCKEIKTKVNESIDCDEITVPPMRGFIEI
jgi:hypothetical protein